MYTQVDLNITGKLAGQLNTYISVSFHLSCLTEILVQYFLIIESRSLVT